MLASYVLADVPLCLICDVTFSHDCRPWRSWHEIHNTAVNRSVRPVRLVAWIPRRGIAVGIRVLQALG